MTHCLQTVSHLAHFQAAIVAKTYDNLVRELDALDNGVQAGHGWPFRVIIPCCDSDWDCGHEPGQL